MSATPYNDTQRADESRTTHGMNVSITTHIIMRTYFSINPIYLSPRRSPRALNANQFQMQYHRSRLIWLCQVFLQYCV